ncbi:MAG: carbohydrate kinase family protein [Clostridia bacterium]|nr:carbohydrate kinase family protein [Clostridia bacterium]
MKKILCISESCCDLIFTNLPRIPNLGEEIYGDDFTIKSGGGANTPCDIGYLGGDVSFLTRIGDDDLGQYITKALIDANVKLVGTPVIKGSRTAVSAVMSTNSDRCFASYYGKTSPFDKDEIEKAIKECDIVHTFLGYCVHYGIDKICEKYGKVLSLDTGYGATMPEEGETFLRRVSYLKVNEEEAKSLSGLDDELKALEYLHDKVKCGMVVTLGNRGSIGMESNSNEVISIGIQNKGDFRDACGAGDAYSAGMLYGISKGYSLKKAMETGSVVSGMAVTWAGGTDAKMREIRDDI